MTIRNQKNGQKNQSIHNQCTGDADSPVKSLARRVHHIRSCGAPAHTPLYYYAAKPGKRTATKPTLRFVTARDISTAVKVAAEQIGLFEADIGYRRSDVSSHSLRA